jgi:hypothetical protein
VQLEPPVERVDAVAQPAQPAPLLGIGPADAVVADAHAQGSALQRDVDGRRAGLGVLGHVGQRLGRDEVGGGLDGRAQRLPLELPVDLHRDGRARGERLQRGAQAVVGEHGRMDAAGELAQLADRLLGLLARLSDQLRRARRVVLQSRLGHAQDQRE